MLFYIKRFLSLEILVTVLLGGSGYWGILRNRLPFDLSPSRRTLALGLLGAVWLTLWTFFVQYSYAVVKGRGYSQELTAALAKQYARVGVAQIIFAGLTACSEELFFRGFIQQKFGLLLATVLFMLAHFGKREIRVISFWSVFQGFYLGVLFLWSKNLLSTMIAHGLFDLGGMVYFRRFMAQRESRT